MSITLDTICRIDHQAALVAVELDIITCPEWGARKPSSPITFVDEAERIIFHHTAGHHREITNPNNESEAEAIQYARDIQAYHMGQGWKDSGHNFLVMRSGRVLQGRWRTVHTITRGRMVDSAHCPGQNDQIGIEHEHAGSEPMTPAQRLGSAVLMAWIAWHYKRPTVLPVFPHKAYINTACPANLIRDIPTIRHMAQQILTKALHHET